MMPYRETLARDADTPFARAFYPKLDELVASGMEYGDAHWHAREHARDVQERESLSAEAAHNRALVDALGINYGSKAKPAPAPMPKPAADDVVVNWDEAFGKKTAAIETAAPTQAEPQTQTAITFSWDDILPPAKPANL